MVELRATTEADLALSRLLHFVQKVSLCNPKDLTPAEWPGTNQKGRVSGYVYRGDIVHYLYSSLIENFSAKTLASHRYRIRDWVHAEIRSSVRQGSEPLPLATDAEDRQGNQDQDLILTPIGTTILCPFKSVCCLVPMNSNSPPSPI